MPTHWFNQTEGIPSTFDGRLLFSKDGNKHWFLALRVMVIKGELTLHDKDGFL